MEIKVDEDNVQVRTSFNKPMIEIENLIRRKKDWITRKQSDYAKREQMIITYVRTDPSAFVTMGIKLK
jgi:predicted metal-dependent hydrolase